MAQEVFVFVPTTSYHHALRCLMDVFCNRWRSHFPLCPHQNALGSWLYCKHGSASSRVGGGASRNLACKACDLGRNGSSLGKKLLTQSRGKLRIAKHARSESHLMAVAELTGCTRCQEIVAELKDRLDAPAAADFEKIAEAKSLGVVNKLKINGCFAEKRQKMEFCVAEAMRMWDREFLSSARSMASHSDGKGKKFTMRFSAADAQLNAERGLLGHVEHVGEHADSVESYVQSTLQVLKNFCTFGHGAPHTNIVGQFDPELFQHIKAIHEVWDTDKARVMVLVGLEMSNHGGIRGDSGGAIFENNKVNNFDVTHSVRRPDG